MMENDNNYDKLNISDRNVLTHPTIKRMLAKMPEGLNDIEKARYVYITLGKIFTVDANYILGNSKMKYNIRRYVSKKPIDLEKMKLKSHKYRGVCANIAEIYGIVMSSLGVRGFILGELDSSDPHKHIELWIDNRKENKDVSDDDRWFKLPTDLQADLLQIQTHQKTEFFGCDYDGSNQVISDEELEEIDKKIGYEYDGEIAFNQMAEDFKKESANLKGLEKIELFMKKIEEAPYINDLGISERKTMISKLKDLMLTKGERSNFFTSYIFRKDKDEDNNDTRRGFIPIYSYLYTDESGRREFARYFYDKRDNVHKPITDDELRYFMEKTKYEAVKDIPGLPKYDESVKRRLMDRILRNKKQEQEQDSIEGSKEYNNHTKCDSDGFINIDER